MFEFIKNHKNLFIISSIAIIIILLGVLFLMDSDSKVNTTAAPNEPNYAFLKENISEEDKYIMLLGKIAVEDYGTYSANDYRGLSNLQNQSTESYKGVVQEVIDSIPKNKNIVTVADPDSVELNRSNDFVSVSMQATTEDLNTRIRTTGEYIVKFVKNGDYWLVDSLIFKSL